MRDLLILFYLSFFCSVWQDLPRRPGSDPADLSGTVPEMRLKPFRKNTLSRHTSYVNKDVLYFEEFSLFYKNRPVLLVIQPNEVGIRPCRMLP